MVAACHASLVSTMRCLRLLFIGLSIVFGSSSPAHAASRATSATLRLVTWNMEWLVDGATARTARIACRDAQPSLLPCDVVRGLSRDSADIARLAAYARRLDADVVAFQEVQNETIARRVFRGYRICMNAGTGVQQVGFALRPGLARDCGHPLTTLTVGEQGRAGRQLTISAPGLGPIELLVVHLKSGCAHDPLKSGSEACELLAAQAHALGQWIATQAARQARFIVLGDFNRGGPPDVADAFWSLLHPESFHASSSTLPFANCTWGAPYREFIDHILVSRRLADSFTERPFHQLRYDERDAARHQLSDHCPVGVSLNVPTAL
jgi:endonuclease/exonuclease/phosphatase family metal-dependent hydrolase